MAPTTDLATKEDDDVDIGLTTRQLNALEKLAELGAEPAKLNENGEAKDEEGRSTYHSNPQIRALQLVYQGRFGGANQGGGRPASPERAAASVVEHVRTRTSKIKKVLDRGLRKDAGIRANLDTVKLMLDLEQREAAMMLEEQRADEIGSTKEELLGTLFALVAQPAVGAVLEGSAEEYDIEEAEVVTEAKGEQEEAPSAPASESNGDDRSPSGPEKDGSDNRVAGFDERRAAKRDRSKSSNPFTQAALRRTAD